MQSSHKQTFYSTFSNIKVLQGPIFLPVNTMALLHSPRIQGTIPLGSLVCGLRRQKIEGNRESTGRSLSVLRANIEE